MVTKNISSVLNWKWARARVRAHQFDSPRRTSTFSPHLCVFAKKKNTNCDCAALQCGLRGGGRHAWPTSSVSLNGSVRSADAAGLLWTLLSFGLLMRMRMIGWTDRRHLGGSNISNICFCKGKTRLIFRFLLFWRKTTLVGIICALATQEASPHPTHHGESYDADEG